MSDLSLTLRIRANADGTVSVLNGTANSVRNIGAETGRARDAMERLTSSIARVGHYAGLAFGGAWLGGKARDVIMLADQMTLLDARIKIATSSIKDYQTANAQLTQISLQTGSSLEANAQLFGRLNKAVEGMGGTVNTTLGLTKTLAQGLKVSGASAGEATSVMIQLSQALSSGVLRGDEFNSIMENGSRIVDALSTATGKSRGELRKMAEDGKLSAQVVVEALQSQAGAIDKDFAKIPLTIGMAMENINTSFARYVENANQSAGATGFFAQSLNGLSQNLTPVIDSLLTLGQIGVTVFVARLIPALTAYIAAKYSAITVEMAHAAAITMDLERTVALTAVQAANTTATVASLQAQLAVTAAMGPRMALTNSLNIALVAQTSATAAATAATEALAVSTASATLTLKSLLSVTSLVNVALAGLVGWEIGGWLNKFETVRRVANDALYSILTVLEEVSYRWDKVFSSKGSAEIETAHAATTASLQDLISETNSYVKGSNDAAKATTQQAAALAPLAAGHEAIGKAAKAHAAGLSEAEKAAKKLAQEEENFQAKAISFLNGQAEQLRLLKLTGKERELEAKISSDLNSVLGELYDSTKIYTEAKAMLIAEVMNNTMAIARETEAQERQNEAWAEAVKQANELYDIKRDTSDTQELARMAESLHLMGATNAEIKQRIDLEKQLSDAVRAHPDQDPQVIRDQLIARQRASDEIAQYTDSNTEKSAEWMEAQFKKAAENIQDSFADMFESMLNGDAMDSIEAFAQNIRKTINQAISQQLALDLQNLFSENGSIVNVLKSGFMFAIAAAVNWFKKAPAVRTAAPSEVGNSTVAGTGAMHIADSLGRDRGFEWQTQTVIEFNKNLDNLTYTLMSTAKMGMATFSKEIASFSSSLTNSLVMSKITDFFKPVADMVSSAFTATKDLFKPVVDVVSSGLKAAGEALGIVAKETTTAVVGGAKELAGGAIKAAGQVVAVVGAIYTAFEYFSGLSDMIERGSVTEIISKTGMLIGAGMMAAAALMATIPVVGWIGAAIALIASAIGLMGKPKVPNFWMNNYNPDQSGADYKYNAGAPEYTHTGNKDAHIGRETPFGMLVFSSHEMSLTVDQMRSQFGELLDTVVQFDTSLYNTIMGLDEAAGEAGKTMLYFNNLLKDGNQGVTSIATKQNSSDLNTGDMLQVRYTWIVDKLAESGSEVGQYINAWFDVITEKFIDVSQDNSMFVVGVIGMLAENVEKFMALPLELVDLIGQSVKAVSAGGTPDTVRDEINGVLNAFVTVQAGLAMLDLSVDDNRVISFLAGINKIGFGVEDAAVNLVSYGMAIEHLNGSLIASGDELMATVEAKFASLKGHGLDNAQINAFFGSFGLMSKMFAEADVAFSEADLDNAAQSIHNLAKASVEVAKNSIDHLIATEKLTAVTRESAIATLVKTGKLEEATVAEAEYGASIMTVTKDLLSQMGFIQQVGYLAGQTLGEMGISANTWVAAAQNVVNVFGDMEAAMQWLDATAKNFLNPTEYSQYNLDTAQRSIAGMVAANPALEGITADSIRAVLQSGAIEGFIESFAQGNGDLAKEIVTMINLVGRQSYAQRALNEAITANVQLAPAQVYALDAVKVATEDNTNATDDLAKAAADAAALAKQYREMEITLMGLQGLTHQALIEKRNDELAAMDSSLVKLQKQIYAQEDANKTRELEHKLMTLQAKEAEVLTATRAKELLALSGTDAAIQQLIWGLEDAAKAAELAKNAIALFSTPEQKQAALGQSLFDKLSGVFAASELEFMAKGGNKAVIEMYNWLLSTGEQGAAKIAALNAVAPDVKAFTDNVDAATQAIKSAIDLFLTPEQKLANLGQELYDKLLPAFGDDLLVRMAEGGTQAVVDVYNELGNMGAEGKALQAILLANAGAISEFSNGVGDASIALHKAAIDLFSTPKQLHAWSGDKLVNELGALFSQSDIELMAQGKDSTIALYNSLLDLGGDGKDKIALLDKLHVEIKAWLDYEEAILTKRHEMEMTLLEAQGYSFDALILKRQAELTVMDESLVDLQLAINAAQDAAKTRALEIELLNLAGADIKALAMTREDELKALSATDQAIKQQIYLLQDLQKAVDDAKTGTDTAMKVLQKAVEAERKTITEKYNAGIKTTQDAIDLLGKSTDKLKGLSSALKSFLDNLVIKGQEAFYRAEAQAQLSTALIIAKAGGGINNPDELIKAINTVARPSEDLFGNFIDYQRDFLLTANTISELNDLTDVALSVDELQLKALKDSLDIDKKWYDAEMSRLDDIVDNAQAQIDAVNGVTVAVMTVDAAINNLAVAMSAQAAAQTTLVSAKSAAGGGGGGGIARNPAPIYDPIYGGIDPNYGNVIAPVTPAPSTPAPAPAAKPYVPSAAVSAALSSGQNFAATVRTFVNDTLANGNPIDIYRSAIEQNVKAGTLDGIMGWAPGTSNAWATENNLPKFAQGINEVPFDMTAQIHQGERILPAADNKELMLRLSEPRDSGSKELAAEIRALRAEVASLKASNEDSARSNRKTADTLERVTRGGEAMQTEAYV
ncbi:MAG: tape measure protein [Methylobacter sp.]|nr:tape measure protein [Methylobacter sp.]